MAQLATARMVDSATSEVLSEPDWGLIMNVVDRVNQNTIHAKDAIASLRKRLKIKHVGVQLCALSLLDALMRNCYAVIMHVDAKEFQKLLVKMVTGEKGSVIKKSGGASSYLVKEKILELLRMWGECYLNTPHLFPAPRVYESYQTLKRSGTPFPEDTESIPSFNPPSRQKTHSPGSVPRHTYSAPRNPNVRGAGGRQAYGSTPSYKRGGHGYESTSYGKAHDSASHQQPPKRNVETVGSIRQKATRFLEHCTVLLEILAAVDVRKDDIRRNEIAKEMYPSVKEIKKQNQRYLGANGIPGDLMALLLDVNEKAVLIDLIWDGLMQSVPPAVTFSRSFPGEPLPDVLQPREKSEGPSPLPSGGSGGSGGSEQLSERDQEVQNLEEALALSLSMQSEEKSKEKEEEDEEEWEQLGDFGTQEGERKEDQGPSTPSNPSDPKNPFNNPFFSSPFDEKSNPFGDPFGTPSQTNPAVTATTTSRSDLARYDLPYLGLEKKNVDSVTYQSLKYANAKAEEKREAKEKEGKGTEMGMGMGMGTGMGMGDNKGKGAVASDPFGGNIFDNLNHPSETQGSQDQLHPMRKDPDYRSSTSSFSGPFDFSAPGSSAFPTPSSTSSSASSSAPSSTPSTSSSANIPSSSFSLFDPQPPLSSQSPFGNPSPSPVPSSSVASSSSLQAPFGNPSPSPSPSFPFVNPSPSPMHSPSPMTSSSVASSSSLQAPFGNPSPSPSPSSSSFLSSQPPFRAPSASVASLSNPNVRPFGADQGSVAPNHSLPSVFPPPSSSSMQTPFGPSSSMSQATPFGNPLPPPSAPQTTEPFGF